MIRLDKDVLEAYLDLHGLDTVLETLSEICHDKAVHIAENWQDVALAKEWHKAGDRIHAIQQSHLAILAPRQS
jgi:hypothetical protein